MRDVNMCMNKEIMKYRSPLYLKPSIIGGDNELISSGIEFILLWGGGNEQPMIKLDTEVNRLVGYSQRTDFIDIRQNLPWLRVVLKGDINQLNYKPFYDATTGVKIFEGVIKQDQMELKVAILMGDITLSAPNIQMSQYVECYKNDKAIYQNRIYEGVFEMIDKHRDNPWLRLVGFDLHKLKIV